jgi:hypothetical protein
MAEWTGLEPATPGVTGRYSNQLNYHSAVAAVPQHRCRSAAFSQAIRHDRLRDGGDPKGIRTPVTTVKGSCPRPLDDGVVEQNTPT